MTVARAELSFVALVVADAREVLRGGRTEEPVSADAPDRRAIREALPAAWSGFQALRPIVCNICTGPTWQAPIAPAMDFPTFKYVFRPDNEPDGWGLRGDPELWRYLAALLYQIPLPRDSTVALQLVKDAIANLTGWDCESTYDESFSVNLSLFQSGSGMSTGAASVAWWVDDGFPLIHSLISRELREYQELSSRGT